MRIFRFFCLLGICFWEPEICIGQDKDAVGFPNIIYIYADDLGYGELGCYGQQIIKTPNLDRMAIEGMRFTRHYSGAPVCAPARCMLLTGSHSGHAAIRANLEYGGFTDEEEKGQHPLPDSVWTIAEMLRQKGYRTGMVGKWGLGVVSSGGSPLRHGFDYYYGYLDQKQAHNFYPTHLWENDRWDTLNNEFIYVHQAIDSTKATEADFKKYEGKTYAPDRMTSRAIDFIKSDREKPFFLYLPYTLPHLSLQVPERYSERYIGLFAESPYYGQAGYAPSQYPRSVYAAMITFLDEQVGRIMAVLEQEGLDKNTIVFFSSDNGATYHPAVDCQFFQSNGHLRGYKGDLYEGGIRVPLLVRWPGTIPPGTVTDIVSTQYDMMATLAELTHCGHQPTDGISLLPVLLGNDLAQQQHPWLYFEFSEYNGQIAVLWQGWKAISRNLLKGEPSGWELYYLPEDDEEKNNLAALRPDILQKIEEIAIQAHRCPDMTKWEVVKHAKK